MPHDVLIGYYIFAVCIVWPAYVICRRARLSPMTILCLIVPVFGLMLFFTALACQRWPIAKQVAA